MYSGQPFEPGLTGALGTGLRPRPASYCPEGLAPTSSKLDYGPRAQQLAAHFKLYTEALPI